MAMPTEEKRVVKKVVVQPDGTKKVIKKIIRKVPKKEGETPATPVVENNPLLDDSPVEGNIFSAPDGAEISNTESNIFSEPEQPTIEQEPQAPENNMFSESISSENKTENLGEKAQDVQPENQNENQELSNIVPETTTNQESNTIDLGNLGFNSSLEQSEQTAPVTEEQPIQSENAGNQTLDMNNLLGSTPTNDIPQENTNQVGGNMFQSETPSQTENTATLNLDQMIQQPNVQPQQMDSNQSGEAFDPFMAMKTKVEKIEAEQQTMFNLDSMASQPIQTAEQSVSQLNGEVATSDTPTLDLNAMPSQIGTNPMVSNTMQSIGAITSDPKKKKLATIVASCLGVFLLAVIVFIRYPDMFSGGGEEHGAASTDVSNPNNWGTTPTDPIPEQPSNTGGSEESENGAKENTPTTTQIESEEIIKPKDPVTIDGDDFFNDDKDIYTVELDEVAVNPSVPTGSVDPLGEVTGLVGLISGNETIIQEALSYEEKGKALRDKGASEKNTNKIRYGTFVQGKARETIDALEKGENIDISSWTILKAQLDEYLQKS